VYGIVKYIEKG